MSHQIDPKTSGASATKAGSDDDEWVYLDGGDAGKAAAVSKGDEDVASGEDACSDDVYYSDYSGEGRLEKAYESDEDLDQFYNSHADAAEEEDGASGEDAYSDDDCSDYSGEGRLEKAHESDEDLDQVTESESDHGAFDLTELDEYLVSITDHAKDIRKEKEVDGVAAPAADAVVDPAACATNEHFDGAAANDFSDYYYDHGDYNVGAGGEHNVDGGLAYHDHDYYSSYSRSSGYGYGYGGGCDHGGYFNGGFYGNGGGGGYFSGNFYGNGGGRYYGGGYGYGGDGYRAGLHPRWACQPYYLPGVGLYPPLPVPYELPYPYAAPAQPSSQYGIVYIPCPASSPMAAAPPEPQP